MLSIAFLSMAKSVAWMVPGAGTSLEVALGVRIPTRDLAPAHCVAAWRWDAPRGPRTPPRRAPCLSAPPARGLLAPRRAPPARLTPLAAPAALRPALRPALRRPPVAGRRCAGRLGIGRVIYRRSGGGVDRSVWVR
jgi:hypothetical protein